MEDSNLVKNDYCRSCLHREINSLQPYRIQNKTLKTILQVDSLVLCYICKQVAKNAEKFIQNALSNQKLLEDNSLLTENVLKAVAVQAPNLINITLDPIAVSDGDQNIEEPFCVVYSWCKKNDVEVKFELKDEEVDNVAYELDSDDSDFENSQIKGEDDFFLEELIKLENKKLTNNIKTSRKSEKIKVKKRRIKEKEKRLSEIRDNVVKDFEILQIKGDDCFLEELIKLENKKLTNNIKTSRQSENIIVKKRRIKDKEKRLNDVKDNVTKESNIKIKSIYITREQCMEHRARMANDKKYLNATYKCDDCIKWFNYKEGYDKHMERHNKAAGKYICNICKQRKESPEKLLKHEKYHVLRFKCSKCDLVRISRLTIQDHYFACHLHGEQTYSCPHCPKIFKRQGSLRKHIIYKHKTQSRAKCDYCGKVFKDKGGLKSHLFRKHRSEMSVEQVPSKEHVCQECGMTFWAPSHLRNHMVKHTVSRNFYCVECDKSFKSDNALTQHLKTASPHVNYMELPFQCEHCDKRFGVRRDLERHMNRIHLNIRPYQCDKCEKAYVNSWSLTEHRRFQHEGHKRPPKFPCPMCDKVFDRNATRKEHIRVHTGERPYACGECPAKFAQGGVLATHVRLMHRRLARNGKPRPTPNK